MITFTIGKPFNEEQFIEEYYKPYFKDNRPEQNKLVDMKLIKFEYLPKEDSYRAEVEFNHPRTGKRKETFKEERKYEFQTYDFLASNIMRQIISEYYKLTGRINYCQDLSLLNSRELTEVSELLKAFSEYKEKHDFPENIALRVQYNIYRQMAFLIEDGEESEEMEYRAWGLNSKGEFDIFVTCSECGKEGFKSDFVPEEDCEGCQDILENGY